MFRTIVLLAEAFILMYAPMSSATEECEGSTEYNVWKFLKSIPDFVVKYKTYVDPKTCESLWQTETNATNHYARYIMNLTSSDDNMRHMVTRLYQTEACSNRLYVIQQDGSVLHNVTLTYSDYKNCAVVVNNDDTTECTALVKAAATEEVSQDCRDKFGVGCSKAVRDIFNPAICSST